MSFARDPSVELRRLLELPKITEHEIHAFLKQHKEIVIGAFATSWNYTDALYEVQFGADFRIDFLVLCANSGQWIVHLIELKSPSARLYTAKGLKSKDLQLVERQIAQRIEWCRLNNQMFRDILANRIDVGVVSQCSHSSEHTFARSEIRDPRIYIQVRAHCLLGRSSTLSKVEFERRRQDENLRSWGSPEVVTYDRLIGVSERLFV